MVFPFNRQFIEGFVQDSYQRFQTEISIKRLSNTGNIPNLYGDIMSKSYTTPISFYGHITLEPTEAMLREMGWEINDIEAIIRVPHKELRRVGLANEDGTLNFNIKSMVTFEGYELEICKITEQKPFFQGIPMYLWIGGRNENGS